MINFVELAMYDVGVVFLAHRIWTRLVQKQTMLEEAPTMCSQKNHHPLLLRKPDMWDLLWLCWFSLLSCQCLLVVASGCVGMCVCVHAHSCTCVFLSVCMCMCVHLYLSVYVHTCESVSARMCASVCVLAFTLDCMPYISLILNCTNPYNHWSIWYFMQVSVKEAFTWQNIL